MNYLQTKKRNKSKFNKVIIFVVIVLILFIFNKPIFSVFSKVAYFIFKPSFLLGNGVGEGVDSLSLNLTSKKTLIARNKSLENQILDSEAKIANYNSILSENEELKEMMNRTPTPPNLLLAGILAKPNHSPYDTLVIDAGSREGVKIGDLVFALGNIPIGKIEETFTSTSKAVLFSSPGVETEGLLSGDNIFLKLYGRGGGNFEINIPRDFEITPGAEIVLPGVQPYLIAIFESIISDPRDSFTKALLSSPVNIQQIKFVQVAI